MSPTGEQLVIPFPDFPPTDTRKMVESHGVELVVAQNLQVSYNGGDVVAVKSLDLTLYGGRVVGVLGGNGAGKTSTLRTLGGVMPPTSGTLLVGGSNMSVSREAERARSVIGYCPDTGGLIRHATIREHIGIALGLRKQKDKWNDALDLVEQFGLTAVLDRETGGFSHGMSRRLSVVLAALTAETLLVLDEPFDGVDPVGVQATLALVRRAATSGVAVIISTHLLSLLVKASDDIHVMIGGEIIDSASSHEFSGQQGEQRYASLLGLV
jgi:ABC-2 type transport system ATP-binding protein